MVYCHGNAGAIRGEHRVKASRKDVCVSCVILTIAVDGAHVIYIIYVGAKYYSLTIRSPRWSDVILAAVGDLPGLVSVHIQFEYLVSTIPFGRIHDFLLPRVP